jgi:hypothetical protein
VPRSVVREKISGRAAVDKVVHNPVEIFAASVAPPRAAAAVDVVAGFSSSAGAPRATPARGVCATRTLR